jgi:Flp pilus assembly protein TadD
MTGAFWRCALVAALFALHPLQVDSVVWVTERKNLLSALFWLLTTWAYARYAHRKSRVGAMSPVRDGLLTLDYLLALTFLALGLMCKPVLVTLPFVLLLLDYWPLKRFQSSTVRRQATTRFHPSPRRPPPATLLTTSGFDLQLAVRLLLEKIPFFVLAIASSLITIVAHRGLHMLDSVSKLPLDMRIKNALESYVRYLGKAFWPSRLTVYYPYPAAWPGWEVASCGLLLLVICGLVLGTVRNRPWWFLGWFWFLGVLVPFSGLVQAGSQAMADRFMYVPLIGIIVAVIWGLNGLTRGRRYQQIGLSVGGCAAIVLCLELTRQQIGYWKNTEALFRHALEVTENNDIAHNNLGVVLVGKGQIEAAISQYQEAIRLKPGYALAHNNLGVALGMKGQLDEAISQFQEAVRLNPDYAADAHSNLGNAFRIKGQIDEAIHQFQEAIRLKPQHAAAHNNLGLALDKKGQFDEAIRQYQEALRLKPDDADAKNNLAKALEMKGKSTEQPVPVRP